MGYPPRDTAPIRGICWFNARIKAAINSTCQPPILLPFPAGSGGIETTLVGAVKGVGEMTDNPRSFLNPGLAQQQGVAQNRDVGERHGGGGDEGVEQAKRG